MHYIYGHMCMDTVVCVVCVCVCVYVYVLCVLSIQAWVQEMNFFLENEVPNLI